MNGKAMMAGTTTPHILSGAELVGSYIVVITDGRQVVASFHLSAICGCRRRFGSFVPSRSHNIYP